MKRSLAILTMLLLLASSSEAGPIDWAKHHKRFLLMEGAAVGAAVLHQTGMRHCRIGSVENCDTGYGSANANFWFATGLSVVVFPAVAEGCWKNTDDSKGCYGIAYAMPTYQTIVGTRDWLVHNPPEHEREKPDLSKVELVHR